MVRSATGPTSEGVERVIAAVDLTGVTERVIRHAVELATRLDAELVLLHVAPAEPEWVGWGPGPASVRTAVATDLRSQHRTTQHLADELRAGGLERVKALTVQGPTAETILAQAAMLDASLIVLGAHHRGVIRELVVGSVARQVLRHTTRPVLIVPEPRAPRR